MGKKLFYLFISGLLLFSGSAYSQVGINTEEPYKLTDLQVKNVEFTNPQGKNDTIPKGIMIPRLTEAQRDNNIVIDDVDDANSLMIYNIDEDCYNYYSRMDQEWKSVCGALGKGAFTFDCSDVEVKGTYIEGKELTGSNYLSIKVDVIKAGTYTISGKTDNGYGFFISGTFMATGIQTVMVPGQGTPDLVQTDIVSMNNNGVDVDCSSNPVEVEVLTAAGTYTMACGSAQVKGVYKVGVDLNPLTNYITIPITVTNPGSWSITTNTVEGISFSGAGTFAAAGTYPVTLSGQGNPTSTTTKTLTLTSNSAGEVSTTCNVDVIIVIPKKKILNIGTYTTEYSYNFGNTTRYNYKALMDPMNFGTNENSIVKMDGWELMYTGDNAPTEAQLTAQLAQNPDIVLIGVWWSPNAAMATQLANYISKGGVVLAFMEEAGGLQIIQKVFANASITQYARNAAGAVYQYAYLDDPILTGPFGDLRGLQWGEDASATATIGGLPSGDINTYSTDSDISGASNGVGNVTAFRHKTLNLVYVADGGFNSTYTSTLNTAYPFISGPKTIDGINYPNYPLPYPNYGRGTTRYEVYNSVFSLNALAWALYQAEYNGINTK